MELTVNELIKREQDAEQAERTKSRQTPKYHQCGNCGMSMDLAKSHTCEFCGSYLQPKLRR